MRLGQLARQLEVKPEAIISFLAKKKDITMKEHPNSKVEDNLIEEITAHFKPVIEEVEEVVIEKKEKVVKEEIVEAAAVIPEHIETTKPGTVHELKIIGKIDLPNKSEITVEVDGVVYDQETLDNKKREELKAERERKDIEKEEKRKEEEEKRRIAREKREIEQERQAMLATEKHNILTKEEERKKEIIIKAQQEREARLEEKRKERQREHYAQKATPTSIPTAKKKKKIINKETTHTPEVANESITEKIPEVQDEVMREKSALKRFIKWLNT